MVTAEPRDDVHPPSPQKAGGLPGNIHLDWSKSTGTWSSTKCFHFVVGIFIITHVIQQFSKLNSKLHSIFELDLRASSDPTDAGRSLEPLVHTESPGQRDDARLCPSRDCGRLLHARN